MSHTPVSFSGAAKLVISLSLLSLCSAIVAVRATGDLYPALQLGVACATLLLFGLIYYDNCVPIPAIIIVILGIGVFFRLYAYLYPPSIIGFDPSSQVLDIQELVRSGRIGIRSNSNFYRRAPYFRLLPSFYAIIGDIPVPTALTVYPVLVGAALPLSVSAMAERIGYGRFSMLLTLLLVSVGSISVRFSYVTIPQTLGLVLLMIGIYILLIYDREIRYFALLAVVSVGLMLTHKLVLFMFLAMTMAYYVGPYAINQLVQVCRRFPTLPHIASVLAVLGFAFVLINVFADPLLIATLLVPGVLAFVVHLSNWDLTTLPTEQTNIHYGLPLVLLFAILVYIQWSFLTEYFPKVFVIIISTLTPSSSDSVFVNVGTFPPGAVPPSHGLLNIFFHHSHGLILLPIGAIAFATLLRRGNINKEETLIVSVGTVLLPLVAASGLAPYGGESVTPMRFYMLTEPILLLAIGALLDRLHESRSFVRQVGVALVVVVILFQIFSASAIPSYPEQPKMYLTEDEMAGKDFARDRTIGPVHTDSIYAGIARSEKPPSDPSERKFRSSGGFLLSKEIKKSSYKYILFRSGVSIYQIKDPRWRNSAWRLTWEPEPVLRVENDMVYTNGNSTLFSNPQLNTSSNI